MDLHFVHTKSSNRVQLLEGISWREMHLERFISTSISHLTMEAGNSLMALHSLMENRVSLERLPIDSGSLANTLHLSSTSSSKLESSPRDSGSILRTLFPLPIAPPRIRLFRLSKEVSTQVVSQRGERTIVCNVPLEISNGIRQTCQFRAVRHVQLRR
jgi:hypothetical protein